jgi:hypothetical protein
MIFDAIYQPQRVSLVERRQQLRAMVEELGPWVDYDLYKLFEEAVNRGLYAKATNACDALGLIGAIESVTKKTHSQILIPVKGAAR